jgi:hypothetical protein
MRSVYATQVYISKKRSCREPHSYNLAAWEVEIKRNRVQGQPRQKVRETPILTNTEIGMAGCIICHPRYVDSV